MERRESLEKSGWSDRIGTDLKLQKNAYHLMCDWKVDTKILGESPVLGETPSLCAMTQTSFQVQKGLLTSKWVVSQERGSQPKVLNCCSL